MKPSSRLSNNNTLMDEAEDYHLKNYGDQGGCYWLRQITP